jgi:hypothetical protein
MEVWQACFDHYVKSFLSKIAIMASAFSAVVDSPGLVQAIPKGLPGPRRKGQAGCGNYEKEESRESIVSRVYVEMGV